MTGMLNTLLDINQIEVGAIKPRIDDFPVNDLFDRLKGLTYHAHAAGLALRMVPCALSVRSDRRLLEQMMRNLISNALKYTQRGRVLVGCRRRQGKLRIEVCDTGIGIPESELKRSSTNTTRWTTSPASEVMVSAWGCRSSRVWANCSAIRLGCGRCKERGRYSRSRSRSSQVAILQRLIVARTSRRRTVANGAAHQSDPDH